jgi:hypothetical protein
MALDEVRLEELAAALSTLRDRLLAQDARYAVKEEALLPLNTQEAMDQAYVFTYPLAQRVFAAIVDEHQETFHRSYTFREYFRISRAFARDVSDLDGTFIPSLDAMRAQLVQFEPSETEIEYQSTGERVPMRAFCDPARRTEESSTCSVCMADIEREGCSKRIAQAVCKHFFPLKCLDSWVNDSGMPTSNTCPSCRYILCEPRQRAHPTQREDFGHFVENHAVAR